MPLDLNQDIERWTKAVPARAAWKVLGSLFAAGLLLFGTMQVAVALAHKEYTEHDEFDAAGIRQVEIHNGAGKVRVSAAPEGTDTIEVTARVSDGLRKTAHDERTEGDRLLLEASCPVLGSHFCDVEYVVRVPADVQLHVRAEETITVSDVAGQVDLESQQTIEVARLTGPARLHAIDGSVRATDLRSDIVDASTISGDVVVDFDDSPRSVRADNIDGDVEVVVPDDAEASFFVDASSVDGQPTIDIRSDPEGDRSIVAKTISGDVLVRYS